MNITVYDFTGIYENESFDFYKESSRSLLIDNTGSQYVSLKSISGTNCICDDYAREEIKKKCLEASDSFSLVRFFDNGNYHYMSNILIDLMCENTPAGGNLKFDLVVFDHHTDMKWTSYGEVLSCGSWILNTLKDKDELFRVFIIGADEDLIKETKSEFPEYEDRAFFIDDVCELEKYEIGKVYISVDKDVLHSDEIATNWDQGNMSIEKLENSLRYLKERFGSDILAVDVCGECLPDSAECYSVRGVKASNEVNRMILDVVFGGGID
ncbi:hypothetical protein [Butyrivibrio sp. AE3004]|uniref:hypothetical protein n=1 Tax=Butyrivibrio sp. AE3004 TaxID=1506994 RepID=UPI000493F27F|nr:hypothetical protein [Butyrivibrio sp. AE3004]